MRPILFLWWVAVISPTGATIILDYRDQASCNIVRVAYQRSGLKVTDCLPKWGKTPQSPANERSGVQGEAGGQRG